MKRALVPAGFFTVACAVGVLIADCSESACEDEVKEVEETDSRPTRTRREVMLARASRRDERGQD
jgi:hypothetical protein